MRISVGQRSGNIPERWPKRRHGLKTAISVAAIVSASLSRAGLTTSPLIQPNLTWVRRGSRVGQRSGAAVQATQMPFSCMTLPSSSMRPPKRRSLTMSQWIAETFVPPM